MRFELRTANTLYLYSGQVYAGRIVKTSDAPEHQLFPSGNAPFNFDELEVVAAAIKRCDKLLAAGKSLHEVDWT